MANMASLIVTRHCLDCGIDFHTTRPLPFALCENCFTLHTRQCAATISEGRRCRRRPLTGEIFCPQHLAMGFGLFTRAAMGRWEALS